MMAKKKTYIVLRGIENDKARYEAGDTVTHAQAKKVFTIATINHWLDKGVLEEVIEVDNGTG